MFLLCHSSDTGKVPQHPSRPDTGRSRSPYTIRKERTYPDRQDITEYGSDLQNYNLSRLIRDIASLAGDFWIRLLYLYPTSITDELIDTIASEKKVCNYIDMPLQHTEKKILELMGRGGSRSYFEKLIAKNQAWHP